MIQVCNKLQGTLLLKMGIWRNKMIDKRIQKTRQDIHECFIQLLNEKDIDKISVSDVCRLANINRKTFYNHYANLSVLMDEIENNIVSDFEKIVEGQDLAMFFMNPQVFFSSFNQLIQENYTFYDTLISNNHSFGLVLKITESLKSKMRDYLWSTNQFSEENVEYIVTYTTAGLLSMYQGLFKSKNNWDSQYISEFLRKIVMNGVASFIQIEK